jgi:hypothetical protein
VKRIITLSTAVILAALTFGCGDKTVINGDTPAAPDYASPPKVLKTVELSFNERNIDNLKGALSRTFVFYSRPEEIGRPPPDLDSPRPPPSYGYTEFWNIAYNISRAAYSVSLTIKTAGVGEPAPEENAYYADDVGLSLLVMADEERGYLARGYGAFAFEKYRDEQNRELWRLSKWWDKTEHGGEAPEGVEPVPFWYILSLYEKSA